MLTLGQLRGEGITFAWVPAPLTRRLAALACFAVPPALIAGLWCLPFYVW